MITIIAGSRSISDYDFIKKQLDTFNNITTIVSGTAKGVDKLGEKYGEENNIDVVKYPAEWSAIGHRGAGHIRNKRMVDTSEQGIYFWDGESTGTKHCINYAIKKGIKVTVFNLWLDKITKFNYKNE